MKLSHNGAEWHGTFGIALDAMIDDLLSDGVPVEVSITWELSNGEAVTDHRTIESMVRAEGLLLFVDEVPMVMDYILAVEVL